MKTNAKNILALCIKVPNISAMIGLLNVTKVRWKSCPVAWKGQLKGCKKFAGRGLEAVVDTNLWFWYAALASWVST